MSARSRELVILRAVGARRFSLFGMVILNGLIIGLLGAIIGVAISSILMDQLVPRYIDPASAIEVPSLPWSGVLLGVTAGGLATIIGSAAPAAMAARAQVDTVLRD